MEILLSWLLFLFWLFLYFVGGILLIFLILLLVLFVGYWKDKPKYPLLAAVRSGNLEKVKNCIEEKNIDINYFENNFGTALYQTCIAGHLNVARYLIERGADIDARLPNGQTPLFKVKYDCADLAQLLLDNGAQVNAIDEDGFTALFDNLAYGNLAVVKVLVDAGADVNHCAQNNITPLFAAVSIDDNNDMVAYLLKKGAQNIPISNDLTTPLHLVARHGDLSIVKTLVDHGVDVNILDFEQQKPVDLARKNNHEEVVQFLERL